LRPLDAFRAFAEKRPVSVACPRVALAQIVAAVEVQISTMSKLCVRTRLRMYRSVFWQY
jgi:hypothetical protein